MKKSKVTTAERGRVRRPCSRFFIAQPGTLLGPLRKLQAWHEWEVGDNRDQSRVCLTSCKRKAELIRDALEAFHENVERTHR